MFFPFGRTKALETQIDQFLDIIIKGALSMKDGIRAYLEGNRESFSDHINSVTAYERQADNIRKHVEAMLYTYSLIPESRGDVLGLLENMDGIIGRSKKVLLDFDVQVPEVPEQYHKHYLEIAETSVHAVENVVMATRCFFHDAGMIKDYIAKVEYYEKDADRTGIALKKRIYGSDMELAQKHQLRYFADVMESLSDLAEDISDRLAIAAIKRSV